MTITLPLDPAEEARLLEVARAKGVSADALVRAAVEQILSAAPDAARRPEAPPILEMIEQNMEDVPAEEFAKLPAHGASEHDHYLYGHPKRGR